MRLVLRQLELCGGPLPPPGLRNRPVCGRLLQKIHQEHEESRHSILCLGRETLATRIRLLRSVEFGRRDADGELEPSGHGEIHPLSNSLNGGPHVKHPRPEESPTPSASTGIAMNMTPRIEDPAMRGGAGLHWGREF